MAVSHPSERDSPPGHLTRGTLAAFSLDTRTNGHEVAGAVRFTTQTSGSRADHNGVIVRGLDDDSPIYVSTQKADRWLPTPKPAPMMTSRMNNTKISTYPPAYPPSDGGFC